MTNNETRELCVELSKADTENTVISVLKTHGLWEKPALWRYFGDREDNFSTIGNQQSHPESALVEKVVNAVDARLMNECMARGVDPKADEAPTSIHEGVALYFEGQKIKGDRVARLYMWATNKRTEVARDISIAATGGRQNPCFTISDIGEGQTPNDMPNTLLSLDKQNKLRIHFVQGKFNMGGTGVLKFCGRENLQLVISRRNPAIIDTFNRDDDSTGEWGFTIIRRENPAHGEKSSVYTYLAPLGAGQFPRKGGVLRFRSATIALMPQGRDPYARGVEWGTAIKLYEYAATGFRTNMMLRDGARYRLDILLPDIALPIRLYECRDFKGHKGSFETTLSGLTVRLEDNKAENLEDDFPVSCPLMAAGQKMTARVYAFKKGKGETYRKNEGIIFTVNGQTHGHLPLSFFNRTKVGMGRLADSLLVVVDCTHLSRRACEDLFMNSRDRLSGGELRREIEKELEELLYRFVLRICVWTTGSSTC